MGLRVNVFSVLAVSLLNVAGFAQGNGAQASITLSTKIGPPTSTLWVAGAGFQPDIGVDIYFDNQDEALAVTNDEGRFGRTRITVPGVAAPGPHFISAIGRNNGGAAQSRFIVNTDWTQTGFGPAQTNWNPYENVLAPENVYSLDALWVASFGTYGYGPESAAPTTYQGRVYVSWVGGGLDELDAFDELTGANDWYNNFAASPAAISNGVLYSASEGYLAAFNAATGARIGQFTFNEDDYPPPPAVVADGEVFFGTTGGYFYAVDQKTGRLVWSVSGQGNIQSAPAAFDGNVYFCASTCYAYYGPNGFRLWEFSGGAGATPAVSGTMVIINGPQGTTALDPGYGTILWRYPASASSTAAALANGVVFVTGTSEVFALDGVTGQPLWDVPIASSFAPAVANGVVYVSGDSAGFMYALDAATGKILWEYSIDPMFYYIVSAPAVANGRVYVNISVGGPAYLYAFGLKK